MCGIRSCAMEPRDGAADFRAKHQFDGYTFLGSVRSLIATGVSLGMDEHRLSG